LTEELTFDFVASQSGNGTVDISATPIPGTLPLFASGLVGFWAWSKKRKPQLKLPATV
jgi:hypothetical protein